MQTLTRIAWFDQRQALSNATAIATLTLSGLVAGFTSVAHADDVQACQPKLLQQRTDFPAQAQRQTQTGIVQVRLRIGPDGRATHAEVAHSSNHFALDRAAIDNDFDR